MKKKVRKEQDSMGTLSVPADAYYGVSTQRSINNFSISVRSWHPDLLVAITLLKQACARANNKLGLLDKRKTTAIVKACNEIIDGKFYDQFPLDIYQAGSGTSTHMNVNEVIAHRAGEILTGKNGRNIVHPNDDVNKGQSTNNIIPSAIRVACCMMVDDLLESLALLEKTLKKKALQFGKILKAARTHLQDAVPITLGQEFNAYATALSKHHARIRASQQDLRVLGVGGNAVGTGLNTKKAFRKEIISALNKEMKLKFVVTKDGVESTQFLTDIAGLSSVLKLLAIDMNKIANDLRLLSSGPHTGLHELNLPAVEPGSSIMPGKINPSICEVVNMASLRTMGNDTSITLACTSGNLNLNTHMPLIAECIVDSLEIMTNSASTFAEKCVKGITANKEICKRNVEQSAALGTALNPYWGYDKVAMLVKESLKKDIPIKQLILEKKLMDKKKLDSILDPKKLTRPNL